jgi:hypothetical protein
MEPPASRTSTASHGIPRHPAGIQDMEPPASRTSTASHGIPASGIPRAQSVPGSRTTAVWAAVTDGVALLQC